jgi:hypothetical protein
MIGLAWTPAAALSRRLMCAAIFVTEEAAGISATPARHLKIEDPNDER